MTKLFLYGTMRDQDVQKIVIGTKLDAKKAILKGHKAVFVLGEVYPKVLVDDRYELEGELVEVSDEQLERIDFFEGVPNGDYIRESVEVLVDDDSTKAQVFVANKSLEKTSRKWTLKEWIKLYKKSYLDRAQEYMENLK